MTHSFPTRRSSDRLNARIYESVNNGVYKAGFATSQEAYEAAFDALFATLDDLEVRLARQRSLAGARLTEADWRLRSDEHTSELQSLMRNSYAVFCLKKKTHTLLHPANPLSY